MCVQFQLVGAEREGKEYSRIDDGFFSDILRSSEQALQCAPLPTIQSFTTHQGSETPAGPRAGQGDVEVVPAGNGLNLGGPVNGIDANEGAIFAELVQSGAGSQGSGRLRSRDGHGTHCPCCLVDCLMERKGGG